MVLKTFPMLIFLDSAGSGPPKLTVIFMLSDSYRKTVIFNGFLTYEEMRFFRCFLTENTWLNLFSCKNFTKSVESEQKMNG